jgi:peptide deformylase
MATIVKYPNPILRRKADSIRDIDEEIRLLSEDMMEAMYLDDGVGLAAPQVGVSKRLIVLDVGQGPMSLINPEIVHSEEEQHTVEEGCLSLPGIRIDIARPTQIIVRGIDDQGESREIQAEGLIARVLQHEIDHLNGILIIDRASSIQRSLLKPKLKKLTK